MIWCYIAINIFTDYFKASVDMSTQSVVRHLDMIADLVMQHGTIYQTFMILTVG